MRKQKKSYSSAGGDQAGDHAVIGKRQVIAEVAYDRDAGGALGFGWDEGRPSFSLGPTNVCQPQRGAERVAQVLGVVLRAHGCQQFRRAAQLPCRALRSEERRVGKECHTTCRSRWSPYH